MAWNCRSLGSQEKKAWVKTFDGDVIALNETWGNTINLPGYLGYYKARTNQAGGGAAVLVKDHLHSTMLSDKIKDTLIVQILVGRSRVLFVVTSYFPSPLNLIVFLLIIVIFIKVSVTLLIKSVITYE